MPDFHSIRPTTNIRSNSEKGQFNDMPGSPFLFQHRPFRDMPRFQAKLQDRNGSTITTIPQSTSTKVPFNDLPKYPLLLHYRPSRDMPGPVIISKTSLGIESYKNALDIKRGPFNDLPRSPLLFQHRPFREMLRSQTHLADHIGLTLTLFPARLPKTAF